MKEVICRYFQHERLNAAQADACFEYLLEHPEFQPEKLNYFEPLKYRFAEIDKAMFRDFVVEKGWMLSRRKKYPRQNLDIINLSARHSQNILRSEISVKDFGKFGSNNYLDYVKDLFGIFASEFAAVFHEDDWDQKHIDYTHGIEAFGVELKQHIPGMYWTNIYGQRLVGFFGRDKLLSAPAFRVEELDGGAVLLQAYESPMIFGSEEAREREAALIDYLGRDAFFLKGDPPDKVYTVPDYSPASPAEEANGASKPEASVFASTIAARLFLPVTHSGDLSEFFHYVYQNGDKTPTSVNLTGNAERKLVRLRVQEADYKRFGRDKYIAFLEDLTAEFAPEFLAACAEKDWTAKTRDGGDNENLRAGLPGLFWLNVFGLRLVEFLGRDKLLNAPASRVKELSGGAVLLQVYDKPLDYDSEEARECERALIDYLGRDAFCMKGDPPDKVLRAPDYTKVLVH